MNFSNIRIVLVAPSHSGNIGSALRVMLNMGMYNLSIVNPINFDKDEVIKLSAGAKHLVDNIQIKNTLTESLQGCSLVIGTSSRERKLGLPYIDPRSCAKICDKISSNNLVAIVFGCERSGLSNADLLQCQYHLTIPANPNYSSLNLASAVQVVCYEIFYLSQVNNNIYRNDINLASNDTLNAIFKELEALICKVGFSDDKSSKSLHMKIQRIFQKSQLEDKEGNLLCGIFKKCNNFINSQSYEK